MYFIEASARHPIRMNTITDRIRAARVLRGWSQAKLAEACGWSPSRVGNYEQGSREPGLDDLEAMASAMWVANSWLLTGSTTPAEGGRYRIMPPGILIVEDYPTGHRQAGKRSPFRLDALDGVPVGEARQTDEPRADNPFHPWAPVVGAESPEYLARIGAAASPTPPSPRQDQRAPLRRIAAWDRPDDLPASEYGFLDHLDAYLSAGHGGPSADMVERTDKATPFRSDWMRAKGWDPRTHFTMRCKGDSMEPTIQDGAPVVIDTSPAGRRVQSARIYAIAIDGELLLKRLDRLPGGMMRVRSDNPSPLYPPFEAPEASIEVIGRAVWTPTEL